MGISLVPYNVKQVSAPWREVVVVAESVLCATWPRKHQAAMVIRRRIQEQFTVQRASLLQGAVHLHALYEGHGCVA